MGRVRRTARWLAAGSLALLAGAVQPLGGGPALAQGDAACEDRPGLVSWDGEAGTSAWSEPTNWSGDALPGPGGHVCIATPGATVSIDSGTVASIASIQVELGSGLVVASGGSLDTAGPEPSTLATVGLFGGTLAGTGTRTLTGSAVLDTGTLTGNGRTLVAPGADLRIGTGAGGTLVINGGHVLAIGEGATATWGPGPHDITLDAPSRLEVAGELDVTNDRTLTGSGTLAVTGTLRKLSHGTTTLRTLLDLDGAIALDAGVLDVAGGDGGLGTDGSVTVGGRSRLRLRDGTTTLGAAAAVSGPGELEVTSNAALTVPASATWDVATTYLTGGSLTLDGDRTLATVGLFGGTLAGTGTRTLTGSAVLDTGTLTGNGRTLVAPGADLRIGTGAGGTLVINGGHVLAIGEGATATWGPGPHDITLDAPSRLEVAGELDVTNDRTLTGSGTLAVTGTLRKLSHGTTTLRTLLDLDGAIALDAGVLDVAGGDGGLGTDGSVTVGGRSRLRLRDGTTTLGAAAAVSGPGELEVTSNAALTVPASATWDVATTYLTGGSLTLDGDRTLATVGLFGGTLAGTGTRTLTGSAVLDTGTLTGNGRTLVAPGADLRIGTGAGGTLVINGGHVLAIGEGATATWGPGPHDITLDAPSRLEVAGELDVTNDRTLTGSGTLAVTGTLRKLSHGTTTLRTLLDLDGAIALDAGVLDVAGGDGGLGTDGSVTVGGRSRLRLRDGTTTLGAAAAVSGPGELEVTSNAALTVPASATWDVATTYLTGGSLTLDGDRTLATVGLFGGTLAGTGTRTLTGSAVLDTGTLTGNGRTLVAPGADLRIGTGAGGTLVINGGHVLAIGEGATATWGPGPHDITLDAPSRLEVAGELDVTNDRTLTGSGTLAVTGTLRKLSHGTTTIGLVPADGSPLVVAGTLEVDAGLLDLTGPGLQVQGLVAVSASPSQTGVLRTTTLDLATTGHIRFGVAGTAPAASAGTVIVTGTPPALAGSLDLAPGPGAAVAAPQRLTLVSTTAEPTGEPTITGTETLPGEASGVVVGPGGVVLELSDAGG